MVFVAIDNDGSVANRLDIVIPPETDSGLVHSNEDGIVGFNFNDVFDVDVSQEDVYERIALNKVMDVFNGINSTVFAYGQTGSGKTYSIFGGDSFQDRGIIPRAIGTIFHEMKNRTLSSTSYKCNISFTEVYKECLYDLLDPNKRHIPMEQWVPVQIFENESGLTLRNINVFEVESEEKALNLFFMGNTNRITSSTLMNNASSRSHAIFTIIVQGDSTIVTPLENIPVWNSDDYDEVPTNNITTIGKLNLVDLAGSERMYKLQNSKNMISEAKSINLSLHYLENVIINLRDANSHHGPVIGQHGMPISPHISYRNSILTSILRDSLGGNCKSCFILTLSTEKVHFEESVSTCR